MKELWKDIDGYDGHYQISNLGRCRSLDRNIDYKDGRKRFFKGQIIKPGKTRGDYLIYHIVYKGNGKCHRVNRLVAIYFIDNPENKPEVNHKDGNKENNRVDNLEWCTGLENKHHARDNGLLNPTKGDKHSMAKITYKIADEIRRRKKSEKITNFELGKCYGISATLTSNIINYQRWVKDDQ